MLWDTAVHPPRSYLHPCLYPCKTQPHHGFSPLLPLCCPWILCFPPLPWCWQSRGRQGAPGVGIVKKGWWGGRDKCKN